MKISCAISNLEVILQPSKQNLFFFSEMDHNSDKRHSSDDSRSGSGRVRKGVREKGFV